MRTYESTSGFMRFHTIDHGAWLATLGSSGQARMYTIGNPLIARTMIKHDLGVGLNVPVRIAVYQEPSSGTLCHLSVLTTGATQWSRLEPPLYNEQEERPWQR